MPRLPQKYFTKALGSGGISSQAMITLRKRAKSQVLEPSVYLPAFGQTKHLWKIDRRDRRIREGFHQSHELQA